MNKISQREVLSIVILLLLWGLLPNNLCIPCGEVHELSTVNNTFHMVPRDVIRIHNNSHLGTMAAEGGWVGDGTQGNPYVIENYYIDAGGRGSAVHIGNTTLHIVLRNSHFLNASWKTGWWDPGAAITLYRAENVMIVDNICSNSRLGILLDQARDNLIHTNTITDNAYHGIEMRNSRYNIMYNNHFQESGGLHMANSPFNALYDNRFTHRGISVSGPRDTFTGQNIPKNNTINGKPIYYYSNLDGDGLAIPSDAGQVILGNVTSVRVEDLRITGSTIIIGYSRDIEIKNNHITQNPGRNGITIQHCQYIYVLRNTLSGNQRGISMAHTGGSVIKENMISGNVEDGIFLDGSDHNLIDDNIMTKSSITLNSASHNTITNNIVLNNMVEGIRIRLQSFSNTIHSNALLYNNRAKEIYNSDNIQAIDYTGENHWNSSVGVGNYWRDWTGPDDDGDGIVDEPYVITGSDSRDHYPLVDPPMPVIPYPPSDFEMEIGRNELKLAWSPPVDSGGSDIMGYRVYRGYSYDYQELIRTIEGESNTEYSDTGLINEEVYFYRVSAFNSVGESRSTSVISGEPDGTPPFLTFISPANNTHTNQQEFTITWNHSDTNSGVHYSEIRLNQGQWYNTGANTSHTFSVAEEGEYRVCVRAHDRAGNNITHWITKYVDFTPPDVVDHGPTGNDVPVDFEIFVVFSEPMESITISSPEVVFGEIVWVDNDTAVTRPMGEIGYALTYNIVIEGTDRAGNTLETVRWSFNTTDACLLIGRVVDENGNGLPGVQVYIGGETRSLTDENGHFTIPGRAGLNIITFQKDGYDGRRIPIRAIAGEEFHMGEITLEPTSRLYELFWIIASVSIVISGILAFALFMMRRGAAEIPTEEEIYEFDEDTEILPAEFFE